MGRGIVTTSGADPLEQWGARIHNFDSPELSQALRTLLSGGQLRSADGEVEVSVAPDARPARHRITIRISDAPYVAVLVVTPLRGDGLVDPDARDSSPAPDRWMTVSSTVEGAVGWELFNCRVHTLQSRSNLAGTAHG